jgi:thymidylate kinase
MRVGQLIVFEGPDGIGKSTVLKEIAAQMEQGGRAVRRESFPGNGSGSLGRLFMGSITSRPGMESVALAPWPCRLFILRHI